MFQYILQSWAASLPFSAAFSRHTSHSRWHKHLVFTSTGCTRLGRGCTTEHYDRPNFQTISSGCQTDCRLQLFYPILGFTHYNIIMLSFKLLIVSSMFYIFCIININKRFSVLVCNLKATYLHMIKNVMNCDKEIIGYNLLLMKLKINS